MSEPVATSVQPAQTGAVTQAEAVKKAPRDSPALPGSGLVPTFERPSVSSVPVWRWVYYPHDESNSGLPQDTVHTGLGNASDAYNCAFLGKKVGIECTKNMMHVDSKGARHWEARFEEDPFVGAGQMITDGTTLYVSHHSYIATGAKLSAYDLDSGERAWSVDLEGIGATEHSRYRNETFLEFDAMTRSVLVFGKESNGGYVERRDAATGKLLANRTVEAPLVNGGIDVVLAEIDQHYEDRKSKRYPGGKERAFSSEEGDLLALHIWPSSEER